MITVEQVAKARMGRLATSKKTNPEHELSKLADGFSWGEMASFFEIMADGTTGTVEKKFIEYWLSMPPPRFHRAFDQQLLANNNSCYRKRALAYGNRVAATYQDDARQRACGIHQKADAGCWRCPS
jgi:hypothetical protein